MIRAEETEWMKKAIEQQKAVAKAIVNEVELRFYARLRKYQDGGHSPFIAAQLALDEMNQDPWGSSDSAGSEPR